MATKMDLVVEEKGRREGGVDWLALKPREVDLEEDKRSGSGWWLRKTRRMRRRPREWMGQTPKI